MDIVFSETNQTGIIKLNRPKALNALNLEMAKKFHDKLLEWEEKVKPFSSFTFCHLKSKAQGLLDHKIQDIDWPDYLLDSWDENGRCFINNYLQTKPLHYHVKKWLTDEHIERLERLVA